jgi:hypothetical protein
MAGVADELAKESYRTDNFRRFHESLLYVCDYENRLFARLDDIE